MQPQYNEDSNTLDNYLIMTKKQKNKQKILQKDKQSKQRKYSTQLSIYSWLVKDRPRQTQTCLIVKLDKSLITHIFKFLRLSEITFISRVCQYFHHCSESIWNNAEFFGDFQTEKFTFKELNKVMEKSGKLSHIKQLKHIYLGKNIGVCRQKIKLRVTSGIPIPGNLLEVFEVAPKNNRSSAFFTDGNLQQIVASSYRSLRVICLQHCSYIKNMGIISKCIFITKLSITGNQYFDCDNLRLICKRCQLIQQLALIDCRSLQDQIFQSIAKLQNLRKFTLRNYKQTFKHAKKLSQNHNLSILDLENSLIMDNQLIEIVKNCHKISFINLSGCMILTDDFLKYLQGVQKQRFQLSIYKNAFSRIQIDKIKSTYHNIKIIQSFSPIKY